MKQQEKRKKTLNYSNKDKRSSVLELRKSFQKPEEIRDSSFFFEGIN